MLDCLRLRQKGMRGLLRGLPSEDTGGGGGMDRLARSEWTSLVPGSACRLLEEAVKECECEAERKGLSR